MTLLDPELSVLELDESVPNNDPSGVTVGLVEYTVFDVVGFVLPDPDDVSVVDPDVEPDVVVPDVVFAGICDDGVVVVVVVVVGVLGSVGVIAFRA